MTALTRRAVRRAAALATATACATAFTVTAVSATAQAATPQTIGACTTSWVSATSGDWSTAANWSAGVPGAGSVACIKVNGTYTVTLNTATTVANLVLGGSSGTASLVVNGNCSVNVALGMGESTVGTHGRLDLSSTTCGSYAMLNGTGPLSVAGDLRVVLGAGGARFLRLPTSVTGNLDVQAGTLTVDGGSLTTSGSATVASGAAISTSQTLTLAGGTLANSGSVTVSGGSGTFVQGAGVITGNPVAVNGGTTTYTGAGSGTVVTDGGTLTAGTISAGQTLRVLGDCSVNATVTLPGTVVNNGSIDLGNASPCGSYALLTGGALTNNGTLTVTPGTSGGSRFLRTALTNHGTFAVSTGLTVDGGSVVTDGTVSVTSTGSIGLSVPWTLAGGSLANAGSVVTSSSWTHQGGTATGTPVAVHGGTLAYSGPGAATYATNGGTVSGTLAGNQALQVIGDCSVNASVNLSGTVVNKGTITLTSVGCGSYALTNGTLTNQGTVQMLPGAGGNRFLRGTVTNAGTVSVAAGTPLILDTGSFDNGGAFTVGAGSTVSMGIPFTNDTGGSIANAGSVTQTNAFTQGDGTTSGTPVNVRGGSLAFTGTGAATISSSSTTVSGTVAAGQTYQIIGDCSANASVTALAGFANKGRIELTSVGCGSYALLAGQTSTQPFANSGTIEAMPGAGGARYLRPQTTNTGTIRIDAGVTLTADSGSFTQSGSGTLVVGVASATSYGVLSANQQVKLGGTLTPDLAVGYTPSNSQKWTVVTYPSRKGKFSTVTGTVGNRYFTAQQKPTQVILQTKADPTVTALSPSTVARGSVSVPVTITGSGFVNGATVSASGTGVTFGPVTVVSSTTITTTVTVTAGAATGARSVTVTTGAGSGTKSGALTVS